MPDSPDRPPTDAQAPEPQPSASAPSGPFDPPARPAPPAGAGGPPAGAGGPQPWGPPSQGSPWGPGGPPSGTARPSPVAGAAPTLVGSAVTLGLGAMVAIVLIVSSDPPDDYFTADRLLSAVAMLAVAAAPVALLLSWDEIDLSSFGAVAFGGYIYIELGDDGVLLGLLAAAMAGLVAGAIVGVVRWLTGAHSAMVTLGAGAILSGLSFRLGPGPSGVSLQHARIDGVGLPLLALLVVVGLAVLLAAVFVEGRPNATGLAGPRVIPGFALSGMAAMLFGALQAGTIGYYADSYVSFILIPIIAAVAIGGAVRGSGLFAPLTAVVASGFVILIEDSTMFHDWNPGDQHLVLGGMIVVCTAIAFGLRRIMAPATRPGPGAGAPF